MISRDAGPASLSVSIPKRSGAHPAGLPRDPRGNEGDRRENLCLTADTSISGARVARELDALVRIYGKPACIVSDNVLCREILAA
jgi:hypothetical protein